LALREDRRAARLALSQPTVLPTTNLAVDVEVTLKRSLAKRLKEKRILVAPGVFDMVSLRVGPIVS
jgi:hypothetical protein